jgi:hypothetical protein
MDIRIKEKDGYSIVLIEDLEGIDCTRTTTGMKK